MALRNYYIDASFNIQGLAVSDSVLLADVECI